MITYFIQITHLTRDCSCRYDTLDFLLPIVLTRQEDVQHRPQLFFAVVSLDRRHSIMPSRQQTLLMLVTVTLVTIINLYVIIHHRRRGTGPFHHHSQHRYQYERIGRGVPARDLFHELAGTAYFEHYVNMNREMFDYIHQRLGPVIEQPRNIHGRYTWDENLLRKYTKCKMKTVNRLMNFFHSMAEGPKLWDLATYNGYNVASESREFKHCLMHFVRTFDAEWIRELTAAEKTASQVYRRYPTVYCSLDGCMFMRRKSKTLRPGIARRDYYDYKHRHAESINAQMVVTRGGFCTHLLDNIPGRMCDSNASRFIAPNEWAKSILVDGGYPGSDIRFVGPDETKHHRAARVHVEWYFGHLKTNWKMVGAIYHRDSRWHSLAIRAAVILENMRFHFGSNRRRL